MVKLIKKTKKIFKKPTKKTGKNVRSKKILKKVKPLKRVKKLVVGLKRVLNNPIISPSHYPWESKATFNPAAFEANGKIHLIYRAIGEDDSSVLGYASSFDGYNIIERSTHFIYKRFGEFVKNGPQLNYSSGGGWGGGCEDPRLTLIDDRLYMIYTAFDGWGSLRMALTSIKLEDFEEKKWNWEKPVLISPPGEIHKNWVIFPEKIKGKFAVLHSISPEILVDYFDSLDELDGKNFIQSVHQGSKEWQLRESGIRGVGPTPIKTKLGWLILYHAIEKDEPNRYKLWAMILDYKNPTKVLYRSPSPILEPDEVYENEGYKWGVIYSCGAVVKDGILFVYYGGADKVTCVATMSLANLLNDLVTRKVVRLKKSKML